jgi:type VI protein secretion system component VasK
MDSFVRNLRVYLRAEMLLAEIRLRVLVRKIGLLAFAALIGVFAVFMLNVAGYVALEPVWGRMWAAIAVAGVDILLALALVLAAQNARPGPEAEMVKEFRQIALDEIEAEAEAVQKELRGLRDELQGIRDAVLSFARDPLSSVGSGLLIPLLSTLSKLLRSDRK